jgi:pSer/pThr/pTyr-binding forkhead associated (FHA) protein
VVPEDCASRRHAEIWRDGGRWFLRDLGSRNGTRLNGMRVAGRVEIRAGDRVSLGGRDVPAELARVAPPARSAPDGGGVGAGYEDEGVHGSLLDAVVRGRPDL